jgi:hypothetical protein
MSSASRWTVCGGCFEKRALSVLVMESRRYWIWGGRSLEGASMYGGAFSLFVDCVEVVLLWLAVSATCDGGGGEESGPDGGMWGCGTDGIEKSLCTICRKLAEAW